MTLATRRKDLQDEGLSIPLLMTDELGSKVSQSWLTEWLECEQPDELDNEEFNVILKAEGMQVRAMSIDLDFKESEEGV